MELSDRLVFNFFFKELCYRFPANNLLLEGADYLNKLKNAETAYWNGLKQFSTELILEAIKITSEHTVPAMPSCAYIRAQCMILKQKNWTPSADIFPDFIPSELPY